VTEHKTYLGDGLYAELDDARMIVLRADRYGVDHWVGLEPEVFRALIEFAHSIGWGDVIKAGAPDALVLSHEEYAEREEEAERARAAQEAFPHD
jgi:hypothetical protein